MTCRYCQARNAEYEHRCARCARRLYDDIGMLQGATHSYTPRSTTSYYSGDTVPVVVVSELQVPSSGSQERLLRHMSAESCSYAEQPNGLKLHSGSQSLALAPLSAAKRSNASTTTRSNPALDTKIEAVIYSEAPTAHPVHRALAFSLDASLVTIAIGIFVLTLHFSGFVFTRELLNAGPVAAGVGLIAVFYGLIWALAGKDTPGRQWTHMQLLDFTGNKPSRRQRLIRLLAAVPSALSCGLGLAWLLVDPEKLSWLDHISETYPAVRAYRR